MRCVPFEWKYDPLCMSANEWVSPLGSSASSSSTFNKYKVHLSVFDGCGYNNLNTSNAISFTFLMESLYAICSSSMLMIQNVYVRCEFHFSDFNFLFFLFSFCRLVRKHLHPCNHDAWVFGGSVYAHKALVRIIFHLSLIELFSSSFAHHLILFDVWVKLQNSVSTISR